MKVIVAIDEESVIMRRLINRFLQWSGTMLQISHSQSIDATYALFVDSFNAHLPYHVDKPKLFEDVATSLVPEISFERDLFAYRDSPEAQFNEITTRFLREVQYKANVPLERMINRILPFGCWNVWAIERQSSTLILQKGVDVRQLDVPPRS